MENGLTKRDLTDALQSMTDALQSMETRLIDRIDHTVEASEKRLIDRIDQTVEATEKRLIDRIDHTVEATEKRLIDRIDHTAEATEKRLIERIDRTSEATEARLIGRIDRLAEATASEVGNLHTEIQGVENRLGARLESIDSRLKLQAGLIQAGARAMARFSEFAENSEERWVGLVDRVAAIEKRLEGGEART